MVPGRGRPLSQETSESGKFSPLMLFDCRGFEPVGYVFCDGWKVVSVSYYFSLPLLLIRYMTSIFIWWNFLLNFKVNNCVLERIILCLTLGLLAQCLPFLPFIIDFQY